MPKVVIQQKKELMLVLFCFVLFCVLFFLKIFLACMCDHSVVTLCCSFCFVFLFCLSVLSFCLTVLFFVCNNGCLFFIGYMGYECMALLERKARTRMPLWFHFSFVLLGFLLTVNVISNL